MKNKRILHRQLKIACLTLASLVLLSAGCSWSDTHSKRTSASNQAPISTNPAQNSSTNTIQGRIVQNALSQLGAPYRYGGNSPSGFDCSGLVEYSHTQAGIRVPRTTKGQLNHFKPISRSELRAGDLAFFKTGRKQYHVAIMLSSTEFIHAPSSGKKVTIANFSNTYWNTKFLRAGRL